MADEFCLKMPDFHVTFRDLLHAINLHGTNSFTSLPKEGGLRIFFALKNPMASAGFEPANLGTKGQHATSRPPKPLTTVNTFTCSQFNNFQVLVLYRVTIQNKCSKCSPESVHMWTHLITDCHEL